MISKEIFKNIRRIQIRTGKWVSSVMAGAYHSAFKGRGMEFEDVREYLPGDEVRMIDWNVTARMNFPYVKNFREERELTVMLMVDVSRSCLFGTTGKQKRDLMAEVAAVLAFSAIKNNDKVGLILFSDRVELFLAPAKGMRHVLRVVRELLVFEPKHSKTSINVALSFLAKIQKKRGICFLLSDFYAPIHESYLMMTAKRHDLVGIHFTDPKDTDIPNLGMVLFEDLETQQSMVVDTSHRQDREKFLQQEQKKNKKLKQTFKKLGAGFIPISFQGSYLLALRKFFEYHEKKNKTI